MRTAKTKLGRPTRPIHLKPKDERVLRHWARGHNTPQARALRSRVILALGEGYSNVEVAEQFRVSERFVSTWRGRYNSSGPQGLMDRPRAGRPRKYKAVQRLEIIAVACESGPGLNGVSGWTLNDLVDSVHRRGIADVSRSQLHRILREADLQPHKKRMWLHSKDPDFKSKVTEIVALYQSAPAGATVLCVDEKTGMQALERIRQDIPSRPGRVGRREFEYKRHGTQSLFAAFNPHTGSLIGECRDGRKADDLLAFMENIAAKVSGEVHIIWDNLNIHGGERWVKFNAKHGNRFHFHYTPLHASWVNQVELWFGILQRRCLRNGSFRSTEELRSAVEGFISLWEQCYKHPFRWTFLGYASKEGCQ